MRTLPPVRGLWLALLLLLLTGCRIGGPAAPGLSGSAQLLMDSLQLEIGVTGLEQLREVRFAFNGAPFAVAPLPTDNRRVRLELSGYVCYGDNDVLVEVEGVGENGQLLILKRSYQVEFTPGLPQLVLPQLVQAKLGEDVVVPLQLISGLDPDFRYGCDAEIEVWRSGELLWEEMLPVPGQSNLTLPAVTEATTMNLDIIMRFGDSVTPLKHPLTIDLGDPAQLTIEVQGAASAPVLVTRGELTVFNGQVSGSHTLTVGAGTYIVDGLPVQDLIDPPAQDVTLTEGDAQTVTLVYQPGTPPPPQTGITLVRPADGAVIVEPRFVIDISIADPSQYVQMRALFLSKGVLPGATWNVVPSQTEYSATVTLNPEQFNGSHTLQIQAQKISGEWVDGPAHQVTLDVPWKASAFIEFRNFPALTTLLPGDSVNLQGNIKSRNGFDGRALLSGQAPAGITLSFTPDDVTLAAAEELPVTLSVTTPPDLATGVYDLTLRWEDEYGLRRGVNTQPVQIEIANPLTVSLLTPPSPVTSRPVHLEAQEASGRPLSLVEFFVDDVLMASGSALTFDWMPDLQSNGPHTVKVVVTDSLGFSASAEAELELKLPFGVRSSVTLNTPLTHGPVLLGGVAYYAGGSEVFRVSPDAELSDASVTRRDLGGQVMALWSYQGTLYAATNTQVFSLAADLTPSEVSNANGVGFCCFSEVGDLLVAFGGSVKKAGANPWQIDVGEMVLGVTQLVNGTGASDVFIATPTRLLHYLANGAGPVASVPNPFGGNVRALEAGFGWLWLLTDSAIQRHTRFFNVVQKPKELDDLTAWQRRNVDVLPNTADTADPDGGQTAEKVVSNLTDIEQNIVLSQLVTVTPGAQYTFSFWAKPTGVGGPPKYAVFDVQNNTFVVSFTSYWDAASPPADWQRISSTFQVPQGSTQMRLIIFQGSVAEDGTATDEAYLWGARLDPGTVAQPFQPTTKAADLCGPVTGEVRFTAWWLADGGGCLWRVNAGGATRLLNEGVALVAPPSSEATPFYLALGDGELLAHDGGGVIGREEPVMLAPSAGVAAFDTLLVPYSDGILRQLDKLP